MTGAGGPLSKAAAARYLGVGDRTLRRLVDEGVLAPGLRQGDLDAYLAAVRVEPGSLGHLCMWGRYAKEAPMDEPSPTGARRPRGPGPSRGR